MNHTKRITATALFAALITIMTAFIAHIPIGLNGGYLHFGDALIYLAASILPTPYALAAAVIGGGLADVLSGALIWAPATVIIKALITLAFTKKNSKIICPRNIIAIFIALIISCAGYYLAEAVLFGAKAAILTSLTINTIQGIGSGAFYLLLGGLFDKMSFKSRLNL